MIYLASSSPRRRLLLREASLVYRIIRPDYQEKNKRGFSPQKLVLCHALGKALSVKIKNGRVLAADTVVSFKGKIIGKPKNRRDAFRILGNLQGQEHEVWTGVALIQFKEGRLVKKTVFAEKTHVRIQPMTPRDIRAYFRRVNPLDKAGAYAIQSKHSIIKAVRGSLSSATGLPIERIKKILNR